MAKVPNPTWAEPDVRGAPGGFLIDVPTPPPPAPDPIVEPEDDPDE